MLQLLLPPLPLQHMIMMLQQRPGSAAGEADEPRSAEGGALIL
jgi:hypothetical protein